MFISLQAVLGKLRVERNETEADLGRLRERTAACAARLLQAENAAFNRRLAAVTRRTKKVGRDV